MDVRIETATLDDVSAIYDIQVKAFTPLLEKYKDFDTNPANEPLERVVSRINNPDGDFHKVLYENVLIGAIYVFWKEEEYWISPMFILPAYQGKGIAQQALYAVEHLYPDAASWELATILEEERNCYFYEKAGYKKTGSIERLNQYTTIVFYKKPVDNQMRSK
ncbi:N-acetyltransferase [Thalassobacillus devorans]|uniref:N-acetyltransferase n=1 Tax=Thalassobacillus devorans TaxID=279813 RepID=A0ABQ1PLI4_9BACI|nr:GNAT family N-acetyltransferase [Thalassobacillus devorans]NIK30172.1 GNAT superfamily N-acetyltransferase [Thalassobacillus devorans]GGC98892.1 N-acetyltransferase [Thalassobacillus devorans]